MDELALEELLVSLVYIPEAKSGVLPLVRLFFRVDRSCILRLPAARFLLVGLLLSATVFQELERLK